MTDWVLLESKTMRAAREGLGLSYETVSRRIHVSSKTYERYEKAGRVPRQLLGQVAEALQLEVEEPTRTRVTVEPLERDPTPLEREVLRRLAAVEELGAEILAAVRARPLSGPGESQSWQDGR